MNAVHVVKRPYPPLVRRVLRSSVLAWLLVRVAYVFVLFAGTLALGLSAAYAIESALHPVWPSRVLLVVLAAALVQLDRRLAREHLLHANFGIAAAWFWGTSLVAAGLSDLALQALLLAV